jgi:hypothetical protein
MTGDEPARATASRHGTGRRREPTRFRTLALVGLVSLAVAATGSFVVYARLVRYERRAAWHVPSAATWAARIEVEQAQLFEPVRRHLVPLLNDLPLFEPRPAALAGSDPGDRFDLVTRLRQTAGLNLGFDLREILIAGGGGSWWIAVGGLFDDGLVEDIWRVLHDSGAVGLSQPRTGVVAFSPWGVMLAQAADGVLLLASDAAALAAALPPGRHHEQLGLPVRGDLGLALSAPEPPRVGPSAPVRSVELSARLGDNLDIEARLEPAAGAAPRRVRLAISRWLETPPPGAARDDWGQRALMARAQVHPGVDDNIIISTHWTRQELARALSALAGWVERRLRAERDAAG